MAAVKTQHVREERWREYTRMMVLLQEDSLEANRKNGIYEIQDHIAKKESTTPMRRTHKSVRQVLMQFTKAANRGRHHEEI